MPVSDHLQISQILDETVRLKPRSILDVGCGIGIYGALCRVYLEGDNLYDRENLTFNKKENWKIKIDCIEGFEKYITDLHRAVYNEIFIDDARKVLNNLNNKAYELVLAIDILEHFQKEDGIAFIKELKRVGKNVIIATPAEPQKQIVPENPLEDHRSCWSKEELQSFGFDIVKETPSLIGLYFPPDLQARPTRSGDVTVRLYQEGDEYGIVKLFKEVFGREMTLDEWRWKYKNHRNNTVYAAVAEDALYGIVGHYGGVPLRMLHNGMEIKGLSICDVMISKGFRGLKTFRAITHKMEDILYDARFSMVYGFPNENTLLRPGEKLGLFERVEDVYSLTKQTMFNNNIKRLLYRIFPLEFEDKRIDILWNEAKRGLPLAVIRDRDYLTWRYKKNPLFSYELWGLRKRWDNNLLGLAVIKRESDRMLLMDLVFMDNYLIPLIQKLENLAFTAGARTLSLWLPCRYHTPLQKIGFNVAPAGTTIPRTTHTGFLKKSDIEGNFFYTMGDTDFL